MQEKLSGYLSALNDQNPEAVEENYQMMTSTTPESKEGKERKDQACGPFLSGLAVWQLVSMWIGQEILLVSPVTVVCTVVNWRPQQNSGFPSPPP